MDPIGLGLENFDVQTARAEVRATQARIDMFQAQILQAQASLSARDGATPAPLTVILRHPHEAAALEWAVAQDEAARKQRAEQAEPVVSGEDDEPVVLGARGHLNADSGLGDWPEGWALVERWRSE